MKRDPASPSSARSRPTDAEAIASIRALGDATIDAAALRRLRSGLAGRSASVAARAAEVVGERGLSELRPELESSFARLLADSVKRDPGCGAKLAVVRALIALDSDDPFVFLAGIRHVQWEPVWGGRVDTAGMLRGWSVHGLVGQGYHDALIETVPLLVDHTLEARRLAVQALGRVGADGAILLLRLKVACGDTEPAVLADAFTSLFTLDADRSLPLVASYLDADDPATEEGAALAIGESQHTDAFAVLARHFDRASGDRRERLLVPLAITRHPDAFERLLELVEDHELPIATAAARALQVFRTDDARRARVDVALERRPEPQILAAWNA